MYICSNSTKAGGTFERRGGATCPGLALGLLLIGGHSAFAGSTISMDRKIEMRGPILEYSATETGQATLSVDLCANPAEVTGSGQMGFEGDGHRSRVTLREEGEGAVTIDGWVACLPETEVEARWLEDWRTTQTATWPGGGKVFHVPWRDAFQLTFPLKTGVSEIETDQDVTYPQSPVDKTTAKTEFEVKLCVRLCDPSRAVRELEYHLTLALGWKRAVFEADLAPRVGEALPDIRARIEAWIDEATPGPGFGPGTGVAPPPETESVPGASGSGNGSMQIPGSPDAEADTMPEQGVAPRPRGQDTGDDAGAAEGLTRMPSVKDTGQDLMPHPRGQKSGGGDGAAQDLSPGSAVTDVAGDAAAGQGLSPRPEKKQGLSPDPDSVASVAEGAEDEGGSVALARRLRVDPATCAIEQLKDPGRWAPAVFPLSQDCVLQAVATRQVLSEKARCLAARQCSLDPDAPIIGPGAECLAPAAYETVLRDDIAILKVHQAETHCDGARRLLWWLEQHAACNPIGADLTEVTSRVTQVCGAQAGDAEAAAEADSDWWPGESMSCKELCMSRLTDEWDIIACTIECQSERDLGSGFSDAFKDSDEKASQMFGLLSQIIKSQHDTVMSTITNLQ